MRLWVLPCFVLMLLMEVESLLRARAVIAAVATALVVLYGIRGEAAQQRYGTEEDLHGAFRYLKQHVAEQDLVLVHAAVREGFLLYAAMDGWQGPAPIFGSTGWPCCARNRDAAPRRSTEQSTVRDLDRMIPKNFRGRIWLYYPTRPSHWDYTGLDEGGLWRKHTWEKGCTPGPYIALKNLTLNPMYCAGQPLSNQ